MAIWAVSNCVSWGSRFNTLYERHQTRARLDIGNHPLLSYGHRGVSIGEFAKVVHILKGFAVDTKPVGFRQEDDDLDSTSLTVCRVGPEYEAPTNSSLR